MIRRKRKIQTLIRCRQIEQKKNPNEIKKERRIFIKYVQVDEYIVYILHAIYLCEFNKTHNTK